MKLYNSLGPNPRVVRMFALELGYELAFEEVDLLGGDNRRAPYTDRNPGGQLPALELDNGSVISEVTAICEYLDETVGDGSLVGKSPAERATTRMWTRRLDLKICEPMANGFRFAEGLGLFEGRMRCIPEAADGLKATAVDGLQWLEGLMGDKPFVAGDQVTMADLLLFGFVDFFATVGQPLDPSLGKLSAWFSRMNERESAAASLHPTAGAAGMNG